ncbi:hypothetical protein SFR_7073 (plasmid) [Streptomyces sp. FR-008]|nr:hypothetical protein SFR_7073 [Streptomyces sp. FR-008]
MPSTLAPPLPGWPDPVDDQCRDHARDNHHKKFDDIHMSS